MKIVLSKHATAPTRSHPWDAGLDLYSTEDGYIRCGHHRVFETGVKAEILEGYVGLVKSRSGLLVKHGIHTDGVIDSHYTGTIKVCLINNGGSKYTVAKGDKIAQLVILPCALPEIEIVDELADTDRGANGFGSTGR